MRKFGFLFAMALVVLALASSTCKKREIDPVTSGSTGSTGSTTGTIRKTGDLVVFSRINTTAGNPAAAAKVSVAYTMDSVRSGDILRSTTADDAGKAQILDLNPRLYAVYSLYELGTDAYEGADSVNALVQQNSTRQIQVIVKQ